MSLWNHLYWAMADATYSHTNASKPWIRESDICTVYQPNACQIPAACLMQAYARVKVPWHTTDIFVCQIWKENQSKLLWSKEMTDFLAVQTTCCSYHTITPCLSRSWHGDAWCVNPSPIHKDTASPTAFLHLYHIMLRPAQARFHISQRRMKTTSSKLKTVNVTSIHISSFCLFSVHKLPPPKSDVLHGVGVLSIVTFFMMNSLKMTSKPYIISINESPI